VLSTIDDIAIY